VLSYRKVLLVSLGLMILIVSGPVWAGRDKVPPSQPGNFQVIGTASDSIATGWTASTDNVGVTGYDLYRNGSKVASVSSSTLTYTFAGLRCATSYTLGVAAFDKAGNHSTRALLTQSTSSCQAPLNTAAPAVSGTATQGQTLSSSTGIWSGDTPMSFTYQWQRCDASGGNCSAISGATAGAYTLQSTDVDSTVRSQVTASNSSGSSSAMSTQTAQVAGLPPVDVTVPAVTGSAQKGQMLSSTSGAWTGTQPMSKGYEWQRCDTSGGNCSAISAATNSTYTLASADVGHTIRSQVTASNSCHSGCGSAAASSTQTASVQDSSTTGYDQAVLADHPVGYWGMTSAGGTEQDLTGSGHNGAYKGGTPTLTTMMNGDKAVDFNGNGQYLTVPSWSGFSIPTTQQLTWEAWIRPDTLQWSGASDPYGYGYVDFLGKCENYSPTCEWEGRMYASVNSENRCNRISAYVFNPGAGLGSGADWQPNCNLLQAGQWLHIVGEYQTQTTPSGCNTAYPGGINIWVNGVEWNMSYHSPTGCMSQYKILPKAGSSPFDIGTMALDSWFAGAIGKVAVYNYLLSQAQINAHFQAMTGATPSGSCANTCTIPVPTQ